MCNWRSSKPYLSDRASAVVLLVGKFPNSSVFRRSYGVGAIGSPTQLDRNLRQREGPRRSKQIPHAAVQRTALVTG